MKVLVVDAEAQVRSDVKRILAEDGCEVYEASDGYSALELLRTFEGRMDAVVSDVKMPCMDGISLAWSMSVLFPGLPVICTSAYTRATGLHKCKWFLKKPFTPESLKAKIRLAMEQPGSHSRPCVRAMAAGESDRGLRVSRFYVCVGGTMAKRTSRIPASPPVRVAQLS